MKHDDRSDTPDPTSHEPVHADRFVERMFSGFGHASELPHVAPDRRVEPVYRPLHQSTSRSGGAYRLQGQAASMPVRADSPAIDVMTDLSRVAAVNVGADATVDHAHRVMLGHGVRALFVVEAASVVLGLITATDVLGERPIQVAQQRAIRHAEVLVRDVMTPAERLEAMALQDVLHARVGDVVASLRLSGRQHALVIESLEGRGTSPTPVVRGIFSLTQIARQLGLPPQPSHDIARTFAELEAAIGA